MFQSPTQSTRTKRAPDIGVISVREVEHAELADGKVSGFTQVQDEDVCTFFCQYRLRLQGEGGKSGSFLIDRTTMQDIY